MIFVKLPIKGIYYRQVCYFMKSLISDTEYHTMAFNIIDHNYETRNFDNLHYDTVRNKFGKDKISYVGPCLFNNLNNLPNTGTFVFFIVGIFKIIFSLRRK